MLEQENKKMEDKLKTVQKMMELDKSKRKTGADKTESKEGGTLWRSATNNYSIRGYQK